MLDSQKSQDYHQLTELFLSTPKALVLAVCRSQSASDSSGTLHGGIYTEGVV